MALHVGWRVFWRASAGHFASRWTHRTLARIGSLKRTGDRSLQTKCTWILWVGRRLSKRLVRPHKRQNLDSCSMDPCFDLWRKNQSFERLEVVRPKESRWRKSRPATLLPFRNRSRAARARHRRRLRRSLFLKKMGLSGYTFSEYRCEGSCLSRESERALFERRKESRWGSEILFSAIRTRDARRYEISHLCGREREREREREGTLETSVRRRSL